MGNGGTADRVRRYIEEDLGWRGEPLTDDFPLIERRVIDSLGLFQIVGFLEDEFGIRLPDDQVVPANFATIGRIAALVDATRT